MLAEPDSSRFFAVLLGGALILAAGIASRATAAPFAYITNSVDQTVSVIDTATDTVTATIPVGQQPYGVAVRPDGLRVYVTNQQDGTVSVIDTLTNTVVDTVAGGGLGIVVHPNGKRVYVAQSALQLSVIDTTTDRVTTTIQLNGANIASTSALAITPDGESVCAVTTAITEQYPCFVADIPIRCRLIVHLVDTATNTETANLLMTDTAGFDPQGLVIEPSGHRLYAINTSEEIGQNPFEVVSALTLPFGPSSHVALTNGFPFHGFGIAINPPGDTIYATSQQHDSDPGFIDVIDVATLRVTNAIVVGRMPKGIALTPDGRRAYVANFDDNTVSVIDLDAQQVIDILAVGRGPIALGQFIGPAVLGPTPTPTPIGCIGDCNGNGEVTVDEIMTGVNIALGNLPATACPAFDCCSGCNVGMLDCILATVNNALNGCLVWRNGCGVPFGGVVLAPCPPTTTFCTSDQSLGRACDLPNVQCCQPGSLCGGGFCDASLICDIRPATRCPLQSDRLP